jgi:FkbM family methyltransferase
MDIIDDFGRTVDTEYFEKREQIHANAFVEPNDVVLELGARFGSVSVVINRKLNNPLNHVAVDPDDRIWGCLERNRDVNGCKFHILKGVISRNLVKLEELGTPEDGGYATTSVHTTEPTTVKSYTLEEVQEMYGLKFTTLVADCEGFLETFFDENPYMYDQLNTVLYETDYTWKCNYDKIAQNLKDHGLTNLWYGSHLVWKRV